MPAALPYIALALTTYSVYQQYEQGEQAKKAASRQAQAQKDSIAAQGRIAEVDAQRARIAQQREARIRRAQIVAATGGAGAASSGIVGATSSIASQVSSNIGDIGIKSTFAADASAANQRSADAGSQIASAQATAQQWGAIGGLSGTIFSEAGGFKSIFGGNTHVKAGAKQ